MNDMTIFNVPKRPLSQGRQAFTLADLRRILPGAARAMSGELGEGIESLTCYCPRMHAWYRISRIIPNGQVRYLVKALARDES